MHSFEGVPAFLMPSGREFLPLVAFSVCGMCIFPVIHKSAVKTKFGPFWRVLPLTSPGGAHPHKPRRYNLFTRIYRAFSFAYTRLYNNAHKLFYNFCAFSRGCVTNAVCFAYNINRGICVYIAYITPIIYIIYLPPIIPPLTIRTLLKS